MLAATQQIDWSGIRAAAIALDSVNAAAIRAGANLPPEEAERLRQRINKRALREQWLSKSKALALTAPTNAKPLSKSVQTGADSVLSALIDDSNATRIGFSKAARKVAESLPNKSESALLDKDTAQAAKHWAGVAAQAQPGWEQEKKSDGGLVSVALIRLELPANMREKEPSTDPLDHAKAATCHELP